MRDDFCENVCARCKHFKHTFVLDNGRMKVEFMCDNEASVNYEEFVFNDTSCSSFERKENLHE